MFKLPKLQSYTIVLALDEAGDLQGWVQISVEDAATAVDSERRMALDASSHLQIRKVVVCEQPVLISNELLHPDQIAEKGAGAEVPYSHDSDGKLRVELPERFLNSQCFLGIRYTCTVQQSDIGVFTYSPFVREPKRQLENAPTTTATTTTAAAATTTTTNGDVFGIATQFEPCHTATAFPCWDHPSCKAKFDFRVLVPNDLQVLSCGEVTYVTPHDATSQWWTFQETIPLPPYVTGFWIAKFHPVELVHSDGRVVRLQCFDAAQQSQTEFGLKMGLASWLYFEELFGVPIPTRKMDLIPLPRLHGLAMENFSAITFRDEYLFVGPETPHQRERRIARLVCHEMSHMYWGNLVTLTTFDELWLKEGMARFFEYVAVHDIDPSYQIWINFLTDVYMQAMEVDSKPQSTHAIVQFHDGDMNKIMDSFDVITYGKGACVLRMLYHLLGRERFSAGMKQCVARHHLANMSTDNLWSCLQECVMREELDLREVMMPWLLQPGFPIVAAECTLDELGVPTTLVLHQLTFQRMDAAAAPQQRWPIPLVVRSFFETADGSVYEQTQRVVFATETHEIALTRPENEASRLCGVIVNGYHAAFCCTYYDATLWNYYRAAVSSPAATDEELFGAAIDHLFLSKSTSFPVAAQSLSERGLEMTRVLKALESGSKLAKGFGRIYLLVPEMQRLSRVTAVANQDEADRLTLEVEALELECELLISEYLQLGRKHEEVCTTMMTLQQHVLVAKSIIAQAIARAAAEHAAQQQQQQQPM